MPQIDQIAETFASQFFWLILTFGLAYLVIGRGMVTKVQATIDDRDARIAGDLATAEAARREADAVEERWRAQENAAREAVQARMADARAKAAAETEALLKASDAEHQARIAEAEARIAAATRSARSELEALSAELARDIVARVSGATVSEDVARGAVKAVIHG